MDIDISVDIVFVFDETTNQVGTDNGSTDVPNEVHSRINEAYLSNRSTINDINKDIYNLDDILCSFAVDFHSVYVLSNRNQNQEAN